MIHSSNQSNVSMKFLQVQHIITKLKFSIYNLILCKICIRERMCQVNDMVTFENSYISTPHFRVIGSGSSLDLTVFVKM